MPVKTFKIGTRKSPLALRQVEEIAQKLRRFYPDFKYEIIGIHTYGDKDKATPISDIEGSDFFTREIEEALLRGEVDFAVHSAKDMPEPLPKGLAVAALTKSIDPYDALVSKGNLKLDALRAGAKVGASSQRRKEQLEKYRWDLEIVDVRGTIQERLEKLDKDGLDAIVVAACALVRLGLEHKISQRLPFGALTPHPLQGSLAVEVRQSNRELVELLKVIDGK